MTGKSLGRESGNGNSIMIIELRVSGLPVPLDTRPLELPLPLDTGRAQREMPDVKRWPAVVGRPVVALLLQSTAETIRARLALCPNGNCHSGLSEDKTDIHMRGKGVPDRCYFLT